MNWEPLPKDVVVTTVLPTFRRPELLARAIRSVLGQTYPHLEVCVYDNASGDATGDVVRALVGEDSRVRYHCHPENVGLNRNFLHGLGRVDTPLFSFLSDDDLIFPELYARALRAFRERPSLGFFCGNVMDLDPTGRVLRECPLEEGLYEPPRGLLEMAGRGHPQWAGMVFRRQVLDRIGLLDPDNEAFDLEFELRAASRFEYAVDSAPAGIFSRPAAPQFERLRDVYRALLRTAARFRDDLELPVAVRQETERLLTSRATVQLASWAFGAIARGDYALARQLGAVMAEFPGGSRSAWLPRSLAALAERVWPVGRLLSLLYDCRTRRRRSVEARMTQRLRETGQAARFGLELSSEA